MKKLGPWIASLAALVAGCQILVGVDPGDRPGATGGGGATTTSSHGGDAGAGGAPAPCVTALGCPGVDDECRKRACVDGFCAWDPTPEGTAVALQGAADCKLRVCDGAGSVKLVDDTADVLDDGIACTMDACVAGAPRNTPVAAGVACGGDRVCDANGRCVACVMPAQCGGDLCVNNLCVPATCVNQVKDVAETAPDCGGPSCEPCSDGKSCLVASDCASGVCGGAPRTCLPPACGDGVKNGGETGVDCGGPCGVGKGCPAGAGCKVDGDCAGGVCSGSICVASCADGVKNGGETGVDCGGSACLPCVLGGGCAFDVDCAEGLCRGGVCVPPSCADGVKGPLEHDVDCGGACTPCASGKACEHASDCASHVCAGALCAAPSCGDHAKNATETGVDCGGPACGPCPDGQGCASATDCASGVCLAGACAAKGCADGVKDLDESDVDCGGPVCAGCPGGAVCAIGSDCASTVCLAGTCTAPTCHDVLKNGGETDVDCGGPCAECALGQGCNGPADCATVACSGGVCVPPTCTDSLKNGAETGVDCGGPTCDKCPGGQGCAFPSDCASGVCTANLCEATCTDLVKDGDETGIDCGGSCDGCPPGDPCNVGADCASKLCNGGLCATPTCADNTHNGTETDVDCGGPACPPCVNGKACVQGSDCASGGCAAGVCQAVLLISQVRTNGAGGFGDDFVELYNPGNAPVTMDATWKLRHQSSQGGACQAEVPRFTGSGQVVPPHGHLLIGGLDYNQSPAKDATFEGVNPGMSLADGGSLWVTHNGKTVDAFCFYYDATSLAVLVGGCNIPYVCEGMPISNLPHDGSSGASSAVDAALERKPGGALGNGQDTGDTAADFQLVTPSTPRNLSSAPTP